MQIKGSAVVVTGGSRGLGAALSRELAARGARVVAVARGGAELDALVASIRAAGGEAHSLAMDMADKNATHAIAGAASALVGPVDLLVHNASTLGSVPLRPLLDTECEDLARVLQLNLVAPFRLSKAVLGSMALRKRGLVVHITSDASVEAYSGWGAYSVSKAALDHLARVWAAELAQTGVRLLSIDPGEMDTAMHAAAMPDADTSSLARPADVSRRLVDLVAADGEDVRPSGTRLVLAAQRPALDNGGTRDERRNLAAG
jgi:NAD(P)-dependent dehydrogenase (short-subunit alcohol dehydrogenase family)